METLREGQPGHRIQIDVKFIEAMPDTSTARGATATAEAAPLGSGNPMGTPTKLAGRRRRRYYQFTAIDDCTRLRVLKVYPRANQKTAVAFLDHVCERLPFKIDVIQTDNGAEFGSGFHWHALDKVIQHVYIKPRTPRPNGKASSACTASTPRSSNGSSTASLSTRPAGSTTSCASGRTTTTTTGRTAAWAARRPMKGSARRPPERPRRSQSPAVAHGREGRAGTCLRTLVRV